MICSLCKRTYFKKRNFVHKSNFLTVPFWYENLFETSIARGKRERQCAAYWSKCAIERELAQKKFFGRIKVNLVRFRKICKRNRKIKKRPFFLQVCRRKIHRDAMIFLLRWAKT